VQLVQTVLDNTKMLALVIPDLRQFGLHGAEEPPSASQDFLRTGGEALGKFLRPALSGTIPGFSASPRSRSIRSEFAATTPVPSSRRRIAR
jgi:hypothetical protein